MFVHAVVQNFKSDVFSITFKISLRACYYNFNDQVASR